MKPSLWLLQKTFSVCDWHLVSSIDGLVSSFVIGFVNRPMRVCQTLLPWLLKRCSMAEVCVFLHISFLLPSALLPPVAFLFIEAVWGLLTLFLIWSYRGDEARHGVIQLAVAGSHPPQVWWQVQAYTPPLMIPISAPQCFFDFHDVKVLHFMYIYVSYKKLLEWIVGCKR